MGFEVQPTRLGTTRWYARIAVAVAIGALIVGVGFASRFANPPPAAVPLPSASAVAAVTRAPTAAATPRASAVAVAEPSVTAAPGARPLPKDLECHGLNRLDCLRAAMAALNVLPAEVPAVETADVYATLICDSNFDCPQYRLSSDAVALGSVTLTFVDDGPDAWVNVVNRGPASNPAKVVAEAWVIRWRVST